MFEDEDSRQFMAESTVQNLLQMRITSSILKDCLERKSVSTAAYKYVCKSLSSNRQHSQLKKAKNKGKKWANLNTNQKYLENPRAALNEILQRGARSDTALNKAQISAYYNELYDDRTRPAKLYTRAQRCLLGESESILITRDELKSALKTVKKSAAGPDRVSSEQLRSALRNQEVFAILLDFLNLCLILGLPKGFAKAKVTLLPKSDSANTPSDFRPISVTSQIFRVYSKILNNRLYSLIEDKLCPSQHGYRVRHRGVNAAIAHLQSVIGDSRREKRNLAVSSIDLSKAFDRCYHSAIIHAMEEFDLPQYLKMNIKNMLQKHSMLFRGSDGTVKVKPKRGVPQGSPISGTLFILVLNGIVERMNRMNPYTAGGIDYAIGSVCLVDDLVVMSHSKAELSQKLVALKEDLAGVGLTVNMRKCAAFGHEYYGKARRIRSLRGIIKLGDENIYFNEPGTCFRYLGINISDTLRISTNKDPIKVNLNVELEKIADSQLSVANKIKCIKRFVIPRVQFKLSNFSMKGIEYRTHTSSNTNCTRFYKEIDTRIMKFIKTTLKVPANGKSTDYFYLPSRLGGLGITKINYIVPRLRIENFRAIAREAKCREFLLKYAYCDQKMCEALLIQQGFSMTGCFREQADRVQIKHIKSKISTKKLLIPECKSTRMVPLVSEGTTYQLSGTRLIRAAKLRVDAVRTNAWQNVINPNHSGRCRKCDGVSETVEHLVNSKCASKEFWINRHNRCQQKFAHWVSLTAKSEAILIENRLFICQNSSYKPDIVVAGDSEAVVVEFGVCWETRHYISDRLKNLYKTKKNKYEKDELLEAIKKHFSNIYDRNIERVHVVPVVLGARGSYYYIKDDWKVI